MYTYRDRRWGELMPWQQVERAAMQDVVDWKPDIVCEQSPGTIEASRAPFHWTCGVWGSEYVPWGPTQMSSCQCGTATQ